MKMNELIASEKTLVIDVREKWEYILGHVKGSKNMPMSKISGHVEELKTMNVPMVFVCASGNRSGQVVQYLKKQGLKNIYNGGSWSTVKQIKAKAA